MSKLTILSFVLISSSQGLSNQCRSLLEKHAPLEAASVDRLKIVSSKQISNLIDEANKPLAVERLIDAIFESNFRMSVKDIRKMFQSKMYIKLDGLSPKHLERTLEIMRRGKSHHLTSNFIKALEKQMLKSIHEYDIESSVKLINLLSKMQNMPSNFFIKKWEDHLIQLLVDAAPEDLTSLIFTYASWNRRPGRFLLRMWTEQVFVKHKEYGPREVANTLYALYLLKSRKRLQNFIDLIPDSKWRELLEDPIQSNQASLVQLYMQTIMKLQPEKLVAFKGLFKKTVKKQDKPSTLEEFLGNYYNKVGIKFITQFKTIPGFIVDFLLEESGKIIQADGPLHFIVQYNGNSTSKKQRAHDSLIDEVLNYYGYEVERLSHVEINRLMREYSNRGY